jgi:hypothetical protein
VAEEVPPKSPRQELGFVLSVVTIPDKSKSKREKEKREEREKRTMMKRKRGREEVIKQRADQEIMSYRRQVKQKCFGLV